MTSEPERPQPLRIIDWGSNQLGPRYMEIGGERSWKRRKAIWNDTDIGYILHRPFPDGRLVPYVWKVSRTLPRPPRKG